MSDYRGLIEEMEKNRPATTHSELDDFASQLAKLRELETRVAELEAIVKTAKQASSVPTPKPQVEVSEEMQQAATEEANRLMQKAFEQIHPMLD